MKLGTPRAIGFDFDHTLGLDHGLERRALCELAQTLGSPVPGDAASQQWLDALLADFRAGAFGMDEMIALFATPLGLGTIDPERWRSVCYDLVDDHVRAIDGAHELLARLRRLALPIAVLTNGWSPLQEKKIARALGGDAFATILVSDRIGVLKPDPAAFAALATALRVPAADIWYVGDSPRADVGGAIAAGMSAVWLDAEDVVFPPDVPAPSIRIGTLRELENLVENAFAP